MIRSINYQMTQGAIDRIGAGVPPNPGTSIAPEYTANWTFGPSSDRETGNACLGIAIGCALSLPIWIAAIACCRLLF